MSRIWTAITFNSNTGECKKHQFHASYDYTVAANDFREVNPGDNLIALMPGIRSECQTYNVAMDSATDGTAGVVNSVDPFSLDGLDR